MPDVFCAKGVNVLFRRDCLYHKLVRKSLRQRQLTEYAVYLSVIIKLVYKCEQLRHRRICRQSIFARDYTYGLARLFFLLFTYVLEAGSSPTIITARQTETPFSFNSRHSFFYTVLQKGRNGFTVNYRRHRFCAPFVSSSRGVFPR